MITNINEFKKTLILEKDSPNPDYKTVEPKDKKRIADILSKSDKGGKKKFGNFTAVKNDKAKIKEEEEKKAQQMAKSITTYTKALRRGNAAKEIGKDNIAEIFYKRAKELKPKNESVVNEDIIVTANDKIADDIKISYNENFMYLIQIDKQIYLDHKQAGELLVHLQKFINEEESDPTNVSKFN